MISSSLRILLAALIVLPACAGCDPRASGAPAPQKKREKPDKPLNLSGDWTKTWEGVAYEVWFRDDMTYGTECGWRGTWTLSGRTLHVREWHGGNEAGYWDWSVTLDADLKGVARISHDSEAPSAAHRPHEVSLRRR